MSILSILKSLSTCLLGIMVDNERYRILGIKNIPLIQMGRTLHEVITLDKITQTVLLNMRDFLAYYRSVFLIFKSHNN